MKSYLQEQLGKRVRELRKIKGYSQEAFAEEIGIATNTLSSIETGNAFMTSATLEKITQILNVTPKDLFTFEQASPEEMYNDILKRLEFIKSDQDRIKIIYNVIKSLI